MKTCPSCLLEYEPSTEEQKICFPCFKKNTGQRTIARDEIVIDIDNPDLKGCMCLSAAGIALFNAGYNFSLWYADGQKQPHLHIKNIPHISELPDKQLVEYKKLFLEKYIPKEFFDEKIPDYSLCNVNHLIAEENKPHFKYKTIKLLRSSFNEDKTNFCELALYNKVQQLTTTVYKPDVNGSGITAKIIQKISIKKIAEQFGLKVHSNKCLCPFHADGKTESLVFYEEQGRFICFGCGIKGNIIVFYALLKQINPNFKFEQERI